MITELIVAAITCALRCGWNRRLPDMGVVANKQEAVSPPAWNFDEVLTTYRKNTALCQVLHKFVKNPEGKRPLGGPKSR
jgi:hypothetical protein